MVHAEDFVSTAISRGYTFFTGVPCSFLTPLINYVIQCKGLDYVSATSEGEAVGIAAGAHLAGRKAVVMCQNSGLGNMVNPLASLNFTFRIPALLIITLRGEIGIKDEPQHELMGQITGNLLDLLRISWMFFPKELKMVRVALDEAEEKIAATGLPFAFIMKKGTVAKTDLTSEFSRASTTQQVSPQGQFSCSPDKRMSRIETVQIIHGLISDEDAVVTTTGKIGRELYALKDSNNHLYVVGSMGCASGIGFGIQYVQPK
ncbi:MAG: thiamine pyrophosphate-binding protein, partial [Thermodesulfobacteriota bacterium]